jgi:carboxylesterase
MRRLAAYRAEREVARRLPIGDDGVMPGAHSLSLDPEGADVGVLLLHGFGDTPQSLRYLAQDLCARGYAGQAPLLPGHGRTLAAFARSRREEWLAAARSARKQLQSRYGRVAIVGQSMGGALAVLLAAEAPPPALILLAPYLAPSPGVRRLAGWSAFTALLPPYVGSRGGALSIQDPEELARSLGYGVTTPRLLVELAGLADSADAALPDVRAPTLLIQSRQDHRVSPAVAERAMTRIGATEARLEWVDDCGHVLTVDRSRERVFALVAEWLTRYAPAADASGDAAAAGVTVR